MDSDPSSYTMDFQDTIFQGMGEADADIALRIKIADAVTLLSELWQGDKDSFWDNFEENLVLVRPALEQELLHEFEYLQTLSLSYVSCEAIADLVDAKELHKLGQLDSCLELLPLIQALVQEYGRVTFLAMAFEPHMEVMPIRSIVFDEDRESAGQTPYVGANETPVTGLGIDVANGQGISVSMYIGGTEIQRKADEPILYQGLRFQHKECIVEDEEVASTIMVDESVGSMFETSLSNHEHDGTMIEDSEKEVKGADMLAMQWHYHRRGEMYVHVRLPSRQLSRQAAKAG